MIRSSSIVFAAIVLSTQLVRGDAQTQQIRTLAEENSLALISGNYARLVDLAYPKVVELVGGRDKMIEALRTSSEDMKANGSKILGAELSEPKEVVPAGDKRFAIVPMTVRLQVPTGALRSKGFLIAVSEDRGKTWTFVDSAGLVSEPGKEREKLAQILPDFPSQLKLPAREEPIWEPR